MTPHASILLKTVLKVLAVTVGLAVFVRLPGVRDYLHPDTIRQAAVASGWWGVLIVLAVGACLPLACLPRWPVAVMCGLVYGAEFGIFLATVTGVLGAALHYGLAAVLLSRRERDELATVHWFKALQSTPCPFVAVVAVRLFPLSNFSLTNLACGLLRMPFGSYLAASFVGMLPSTAVFVLAGQGAFNANAWLVFWALTLAALLVPLSVWMAGRGMRKSRCAEG